MGHSLQLIGVIPKKEEGIEKGNEKRIELWSGYLSFNHSVFSKYWCVHDHFQEQSVPTILRELKRAINELQTEGVVAEIKKDVWETTKSCFLSILLQMYYDFVNLKNTHRKLVKENGVKFLLEGFGLSDQSWVKKELPECKDEEKDEKIFDEAVKEPKLLNGPFKISSREEAETLYFRMLRNGWDEDSRIVKMVKDIALKDW